MGFADFILEMAYRKQASIEKIEDQISPLSQHIVKCWAMNDSESLEHWKREIRNIVNTMDSAANVKTKFGRLRAKEMFKEYAWHVSEKTLQNLLKKVEADYNIAICERDSANYKKWLKGFFGRLWVMLEEDSIDYDKIFKDLNI